MVIEKIKAKAGFGGAKVEIHLPKDKYSLSETLKGEVTIIGGKVEQEITILTITLIRDWSWECYSAGRDIDLWGDYRGAQSTASISDQAEYELNEDKGMDEVLNIELENNIEIKPEEERTFAFLINLSSIQLEEGINEKWKLKARADIPFAKDAFSEKEIELVPPNKMAKEH